MTAPATHTHAPTPFFHDDSGAVRFWVRTDSGAFIGASVPKGALHYRFKAALDGSDALMVYQANQREIDAAVLRRVASGSIEPVMLRERDLAAQA
jgi:hypothetical protein